VWNAILLFAGKSLGSNWRTISPYLKTYGQIVLIISIVVILIMFSYGYFRNRKQH
jgi:membrane protein DedA with SNARE-associated domain